MPIDAVVFDLDGVLIDSEPVWERVRRAFVTEHGGHWAPDTQSRLMGMSTAEWAAYLSRELGVDLPPERVAGDVIERITAAYAEHLPVLPGALEAVGRIGDARPVALASSSPLPVILGVLRQSGLAAVFRAVASSDEVARGKPDPDVYLLATGRLGVDPARAAAVEDSSNGLRSAAAAGLTVVAAPRPEFPPEPGALGLAAVVLDGPQPLDRLTVDLLERLRSRS